MKHCKSIVTACLVLAMCTSGAMAATTTAYPTEVNVTQVGGTYQLEKVYILSVNDDPTTIPTEDFQREGLTYTLLDVLKDDQTETNTKEYSELVTLETDTKDVAEIIPLLEPEREVATDDGYVGILYPDYTDITVEVEGYKSTSWTVSASRTYPNLSDADVSLIPKTVEDSGRTLTLANVDWQETTAQAANGLDVTFRYTAVASYTGTATGKSVTGYTATVNYVGDLTQTNCDTVIYTALFAAYPEEVVEPIQDTVIEDATVEEVATTNYPLMVILILVGAAALGGLGYLGWKGIRHYRDKKRGYVQ